MNDNVESKNVKYNEIIKQRKQLSEEQKKYFKSKQIKLTKTQKQLILKSYLGHYTVPISDEVLKILENFDIKKKSYLIYGSPYNVIQQAVAYYLLKFQFLDYIRINAYDILQTRFEKLDDDQMYSKCFYHIPEQLLITHIQDEMIFYKNFETTIAQVLEYRLIENKLTIITSGSRLNKFKDREGFEVIDLMYALGIEDIKEIPKSPNYEELDQYDNSNIPNRIQQWKDIK